MFAYSLENTFNSQHGDTDSGMYSMTSSVTLRSSSFIPPDPDLEVEESLPSLDEVIPKPDFKKLKPKEKKRQDVINGEINRSNHNELKSVHGWIPVI